MRRILVAGNWKMHGSVDMTTELIAGVSNSLSEFSESGELAYDILVCPPFPYLAKAADIAGSQSINVAVGAQNVSPHASGAYTGEISLSMVAELGCTYVLLGHSERREYYDETDEIVAEKFAACIEAEPLVTPVLCIGESLAEREAGDTEAVVERQINAVLDKVGIEGFTNSVIAYEPVWAIGTGETASPEQAQQVHRFIRSLLEKHDGEIANKIQLLYGGSVKPGNAKELFAQQDIDGGLIGGASLDVESFAGICKAAQKLASS